MGGFCRLYASFFTQGAVNFWQMDSGLVVTDNPKLIYYKPAMFDFGWNLKVEHHANSLVRMAIAKRLQRVPGIGPI